MWAVGLLWTGLALFGFVSVGTDAKLVFLPIHRTLSGNSFSLQLFLSETMGPDRACSDALDRVNDPMYHPSHARLGPRYEVLTGTIQKENNKHNRERAHKQDREHDQGGDHLLDVIEAYCRQDYLRNARPAATHERPNRMAKPDSDRRPVHEGWRCDRPLRETQVHGLA